MFHCGLLQQLCTILMATGVPADILTEVRGQWAEGGVGASPWVIRAVCRDSQLLQGLTGDLLSSCCKCQGCQLPVGSRNGEVIYTGEILVFCSHRGFGFACFFFGFQNIPEKLNWLMTFLGLGVGLLLFFLRIYRYSSLIGFQWWGILASRKPCQQCRMKGFSLDKTMCLYWVWTPPFQFLKGFTFPLVKNVQFSCYFAVIEKLIWHTKWSWRGLSYVSLNLCSAYFTVVNALI